MKKTGVRMVAAAFVWSGRSSMPARAKGLAQTITLRAALKKFGLGLALAALGLAPGARADTVTEWNANLERAIFATAQTAGAQPRFSAIVQTAVYDAVNGIARKYTPYFVTEPAPGGARPEAAAAQAAYTALKALYPSPAVALHAKPADSLASTPGSANSQSIARGRAWGEHVATLILAWRSTDGWSTPPPPYFGGGAPGVWRSPPTATDADGTLPALFPQMAILVPFAM